VISIDRIHGPNGPWRTIHRHYLSQTLAISMTNLGLICRNVAPWPYRGRTTVMRRSLRGTIATALVLALLPLAAVLMTAGSAGAATWQPRVDPDVNANRHLTEFEDRVLAGINERRTNHGKRRIRLFQSCLDGFSEDWSRYLARTGRFEHRNQNKVLDSCHQTWVGENLARGERMRPRDVVRAWWRSPGHRAIMMKSRANRAGVSVTRADNGVLYAVLNLGDVS
jgi:uncharacterized protein YkwD